MYAETIIKPRFYETDQAGHINNTVVPQWLEVARTDFLFQHAGVNPSMMLRHVAVNYDRELNFPDEVIVRTSLERLSRSTVTYRQEIWQNDICRITATAVDCYFDPATRSSAPIPDNDRRLYEPYLNNTQS